MELSKPVQVEDLRATYPRDTRGMEDVEIDQKLDMLEGAIRSDFGVTDTSERASQSLYLAMLAAWPSFLLQLHQTASETVGTNSASHTTAQPGQIDWPVFVGRVLAPVSAVAESPHVTQLVR